MFVSARPLIIRQIPKSPKRCVFKSVSTIQVQKRPKYLPNSVSNDELIAWSKIVGDGICAFTFLYCSLNWMMYRRARLDIEDGHKDKNEKKK